MNSFSVEKFRNVIQKGSKPKQRPRPCLVVSKDFKEILEGQFNLKVEAKPRKCAKSRHAINRHRSSHLDSNQSFSPSEAEEQVSLDESAFKEGVALDIRLTEFMRVLNSKESFEDPTLRASLLIQDIKSNRKSRPLTNRTPPIFEDPSPSAFIGLNFVEMLRDRESKPELITKAQIRENLKNVKFDSKVFDIYEPEFTSDEEFGEKKEELAEAMNETEIVNEKGKLKEKLKERSERWPTISTKWSRISSRGTMSSGSTKPAWNCAWWSEPAI